MKRVSDQVPVFQFDSSFVFTDQYIEFTTATNENSKTFGLGESSRLNHALKTDQTYTFWAIDLASLVKDKNLYSSFPYYLQMLDGKAHGALLMNRYWSYSMLIYIYNWLYILKQWNGCVSWNRFFDFQDDWWDHRSVRIRGTNSLVRCQPIHWCCWPSIADALLVARIP